MDVHKKTISDREAEIIQLLKELNLLDCTLVQEIEDNVLTEKKGSHVSRSQWDIIKMYEEIIRPFHRIKFDKFSPGFYCHINLDEDADVDDYRVYLLNGLRNTIAYTTDKENSDKENCDKENCDEEKYVIFREIEKTVKELIDNGIEINQFNLLHGDLYNGNILFLDGKYMLIDFEYVRFGPSQLEWAFLLFWDLITEEDTEIRKKFLYKVCDDLKILKANNILSDLDIKLILELFLPCIICLSLDSCDISIFESKDIIREGLIRFWNYEYLVVKDEIYG